MSLGIVIKSPEGLILAAESRVTLLLNTRDGGAALPVTFDNTTKLLSFSRPNDWIGAVTYGQALIGQRTAHSFVPEFEALLMEKGNQRLTVFDFATELGKFYLERWREANLPESGISPLTLVVGGFDDGAPYGRVFVVDVPTKPLPEERNGEPGQFGITWGGQSEIVSRIIQGYDPGVLEIIARTLSLNREQVDQLRKILLQVHLPIPYDLLALQDAVDLAVFLLRSTIAAQTLSIGIRGCGGPIDVATITRREGLRFVQRKRIRGEDYQSQFSSESSSS